MPALLHPGVYVQKISSGVHPIAIGVNVIRMNVRTHLPHPLK
jgi:hypothetical protein